MACEIGTPVHATACRGQVEGGTLQGIGYGLMEEMKIDAGRPLNTQLSTYLIPTIEDAPRVEVLLVSPGADPASPKGVGELPVDGAAAAVVAAIANAMGLEIATIPATPERLMAADAVRAWCSGADASAPRTST